MPDITPPIWQEDGGPYVSRPEITDTPEPMPTDEPPFPGPYSRPAFVGLWD